MKLLNLFFKFKLLFAITLFFSLFVMQTEAKGSKLRVCTGSNMSGHCKTLSNTRGGVKIRSTSYLKSYAAAGQRYLNCDIFRADFYVDHGCSIKEGYRCINNEYVYHNIKGKVKCIKISANKSCMVHTGVCRFFSNKVVDGIIGGVALFGGAILTAVA